MSSRAGKGGDGAGSSTRILLGNRGQRGAALGAVGWEETGGEGEGQAEKGNDGGEGGGRHLNSLDENLREARSETVDPEES